MNVEHNRHGTCETSTPIINKICEPFCDQAKMQLMKYISGDESPFYMIMLGLPQRSSVAFDVQCYIFFVFCFCPPSSVRAEQNNCCGRSWRLLRWRKTTSHSTHIQTAGLCIGKLCGKIGSILSRVSLSCMCNSINFHSPSDHVAPALQIIPLVQRCVCVGVCVCLSVIRYDAKHTLSVGGRRQCAQDGSDKISGTFVLALALLCVYTPSTPVFPLHIQPTHIKTIMEFGRAQFDRVYGNLNKV